MHKDADGPSDFSVIAAATVLLHARRRVAQWMLLGAVLAAALVLLRPRQYRTTVSFQPQGQDARQSGLASIAGQFGVSIPGNSNALSSDFYAALTRSRMILSSIAADSVPSPDEAGGSSAILDLLEVKDGDREERLEKGIKQIRKQTSVSVQKASGLVEVSVVTKWPTVSADIARRLLWGVNDFNVRSTQRQASAERLFIESRLDMARRDLRDAEDRLEEFLRENRQVESSPALAFQRDRLQRAVGLRQDVFATLTQSHEEVRMREVRAIPVIMVVDSAVAAPLPESRQGLTMVVIGGMLFGTIGALLALGAHRANKESSDDDLSHLLAEVRIAAHETTSFFRRRP